MAGVQFADVRKSFGAFPVIKGVDIDIADGEFVILVGPSGCGKSTLLRMLAGLENISGGEIKIGGRVVNTLPPKDRDIAMLGDIGPTVDRDLDQFLASGRIVEVLIGEDRKLRADRVAAEIGGDVGKGLEPFDVVAAHIGIRMSEMVEAPIGACHVTPAIVAGGIYYDAKISRPERLVYELVSDGLDANARSLAANFATLAAVSEGHLTFRQPDGRDVTVAPKLVVNAAGPWIDHVNTLLGAPSHLIGGTKGSHILLDHPELVRSLNGHMRARITPTTTMTANPIARCSSSADIASRMRRACRPISRKATTFSRKTTVVQTAKECTRIRGESLTEESVASVIALATVARTADRCRCSAISQVEKA